MCFSTNCSETWLTKQFRLSGLVLMQTVEGRDLAVKQLNGRLIRGQRVVLQTFNNLTQGK
jgi:hypothetical protein